MKICITGGHLSPAIAFYDEMYRRHPDWKFFWIGRKKAIAGDKEESQESISVKECGMPFYPLTAGRMNRMISTETFYWLLYIPIGFFQALCYCIREHPSVIVSFGGYIALPVALSGWILRVPIVIHEQTRVPGLSNIIIARIATKICASFPESEKDFDKNKVLLTGLPLRRELYIKNKRAFFQKKPDKPLLYIGGGTTGSVSMNQILFESLPLLLQDFQIIHQTGSQSFEKALQIKNSFEKKIQESYVPVKYLDAKSLSAVYASCSVYLGRSGANTVYELALFRIPSIFIPLPWSSGGEQEVNARFFQKYAGAVVLDQKTLRAEKLPEIVRTVNMKGEEYRSRMKKVSSLFPSDGASRFCDAVETVLS